MSADLSTIQAPEPIFHASLVTDLAFQSELISTLQAKLAEATKAIEIKELVSALNRATLARRTTLRELTKPAPAAKPGAVPEPEPEPIPLANVSRARAQASALRI